MMATNTPSNDTLETQGTIKANEAPEAPKKPTRKSKGGKTLKLEPTMPMVEAARLILSAQWEQVLAHEPLVLEGNSIEALHQMRVATRQMRSVYALLSKYLPKRYKPKPLLRRLRRTARYLGDVRDLDVFLQTADPDTVAPYWGETYQMARSKLEKWLRSSGYANFKAEFQALLETPYTPSPKDTAALHTVSHLLPVLIYSQLATIRVYDSLIAGQDVATLHALRIHFKKFRYTVEFFRSVMGAKVKTVIETLKNQQDTLGKMNDHSVAIQFLEKTAALMDDAAAQTIRQEIEAQHTALLETLEQFPAAWAQFNNPDLRQNIAECMMAL